MMGSSPSLLGRKSKARDGWEKKGGRGGDQEKNRQKRKGRWGEQQSHKKERRGEDVVEAEEAA